MIFWENWAGLLLAFFIIGHQLYSGRDSVCFTLAIAFYFVSAMGADFVMHGFSFGELIGEIGSSQLYRVSESSASAYLNLCHTVGFLCHIGIFAGLLGVSDSKDPRHFIRVGYVVFVGVKSAFGAYYSADVFDGSSLSDVNKFIEDYSVAVDVIVLTLGTNNALSERWLKK